MIPQQGVKSATVSRTMNVGSWSRQAWGGSDKRSTSRRALPRGNGTGRKRESNLHQVPFLSLEKKKGFPTARHRRELGGGEDGCSPNKPKYANQVGKVHMVTEANLRMPVNNHLRVKN